MCFTYTYVKTHVFSLLIAYIFKTMNFFRKSTDYKYMQLHFLLSNADFSEIHWYVKVI